MKTNTKTLITVIATAFTLQSGLALADYSTVNNTQLVSTQTAQKSKIKPYPLDICVVSDEELDSMDDELSFVYKNQEIKVCCKPCVKKFKKNPKKFLKIIEKNKAEKAQK